MPTQDIDIEPYKRLMVYASVGAVPLDAVATSLSITKNAVICFISGAKRSPSVYEKLRSAGYADEAIPTWFARPQRAPPPPPPAPAIGGTDDAKEKQSEAPEKPREPKVGAKEPQPPEEKPHPNEEVPASALRSTMRRGQARNADLEKKEHASGERRHLDRRSRDMIDPWALGKTDCSTHFSIAGLTFPYFVDSDRK